MWEFITAIIFLLIGYGIGFYHDKLKLIETVSQSKKAKTPPAPIAQSPKKSGVIDYPTQEDIDYVESGEEKVDEARTKLFEEQFKL